MNTSRPCLLPNSPRTAEYVKVLESLIRVENLKSKARGTPEQWANENGVFS
jgi:hypothetical protein